MTASALFDFDGIKHHKEPQVIPQPPKRELYKGPGGKVELADQPGGFGDVKENLDGTQTISGFLAFIAAPIPMLIGFWRLLNPQQRGLFALISGFGAFTLSLPVFMTATPYPAGWVGPIFTGIEVLGIPLIVGIGKLNYKHALKVRTAAFWGWVIGVLSRYGIFLVYGYW